MKVRGLGNSCFTINHITARFFEVFILACWFLATSHISPNHPQELAQLALAHFDHTMPGLCRLLPKIQKPGFAFELETALVFAAQRESVIGLDLDIAFFNPQETVCVEGQPLQLHTTEFDVITDHFAVECKCIKRVTSKNIHQFIKERNMIAWCQELARDIAQGKMSYSFMYASSGKPFIGIQSPSTYNRCIPICSTWLTAPTPKECFDQLKDIILLLAQKKPVVAFSKPISPALFIELKDLNITALGNVHLGQKPVTTIEDVSLLFAKMNLESAS